MNKQCRGLNWTSGPSKTPRKFLRLYCDRFAEDLKAMGVTKSEAPAAPEHLKAKIIKRGPYVFRFVEMFNPRAIGGQFEARVDTIFEGPQ